MPPSRGSWRVPGNLYFKKHPPHMTPSGSPTLPHFGLADEETEGRRGCVSQHSITIMKYPRQLPYKREKVYLGSQFWRLQSKVGRTLCFGLWWAPGWGAECQWQAVFSSQGSPGAGTYFIIPLHMGENVDCTILQRPRLRKLM